MAQEEHLWNRPEGWYSRKGRKKMHVQNLIQLWANLWLLVKKQTWQSLCMWKNKKQKDKQRNVKSFRTQKFVSCAFNLKFASYFYHNLCIVVFLVFLMLFLSDDFADPVEQDELRSQLTMFSKISGLQVCFLLTRLGILNTYWVCKVTGMILHFTYIFMEIFVMLSNLSHWQFLIHC